MNSEKYAKTVWGLLPHEDPRGRYERTRDERCAALADQFGLTERETEVLRLLARNKRPREISDVLVVSVAARTFMPFTRRRACTRLPSWPSL